MAHTARQLYSFYDYVELDEQTDVKHEFLDGQAWAMAGGTPEHAAISAKIASLLGSALGSRPRRVFSSDLRVRVQATGLATYPDVTIVCEKLALDPEDHKGHTITNPRVLVEVLSPSTEDYDRGEKLGHYKQIQSLAEVVLVAHDRREIEVVRREGDGSWSRHIAGDGEVTRLVSLDCDLPVSEVYRNPLDAVGPT
jgi:Uma2 family endonuclease